MGNTEGFLSRRMVQKINFLNKMIKNSFLKIFGVNQFKSLVNKARKRRYIDFVDREIILYIYDFLYFILNVLYNFICFLIQLYKLIVKEQSFNDYELEMKDYEKKQASRINVFRQFTFYKKFSIFYDKFLTFFSFFLFHKVTKRLSYTVVYFIKFCNNFFGRLFYGDCYFCTKKRLIFFVGDFILDSVGIFFNNSDKYFKKICICVPSVIFFCLFTGVATSSHFVLEGHRGGAGVHDTSIPLVVELGPSESCTAIARQCILNNESPPFIGRMDITGELVLSNDFQENWDPYWRPSMYIPADGPPHNLQSPVISFFEGQPKVYNFTSLEEIYKYYTDVGYNNNEHSTEDIVLGIRFLQGLFPNGNFVSPPHLFFGTNLGLLPNEFLDCNDIKDWGPAYGEFIKLVDYAYFLNGLDRKAAILNLLFNYTEDDMVDSFGFTFQQLRILAAYVREGPLVNKDPVLESVINDFIIRDRIAGLKDQAYLRPMPYPCSSFDAELLEQLHSFDYLYYVVAINGKLYDVFTMNNGIFEERPELSYQQIRMGLWLLKAEGFKKCIDPEYLPKGIYYYRDK